ncbi:MAG TPA: TolC family protein [Pirellulales bacterium]
MLRKASWWRRGQNFLCGVGLLRRASFIAWLALGAGAAEAAPPAGPPAQPRGYSSRQSKSDAQLAPALREGDARRQRRPDESAAERRSHETAVITPVRHRRWQTPPTADDPFGNQVELLWPALVEQVLARNRTIDAMAAAWRAARERYPQAIALDDPVFTSMLAPASLNSGIAKLPGNSAGYLVGGAQKLPWFGKRQWRGEVARRESGAAWMDLQDTRLQIVEAAGLAYFDYFLARRRLALNLQNTAKLRQFREIAQRQYEATLAPQQDMLQADVELAELTRQQIELERLERIAVARINTLLHRVPDAYLPVPPDRLASPLLALSPSQLRAGALARRPDLAALAAELRAEQARLQLAFKEFYPDFELFGRYDNFWAQPTQRGQVGLNMNVPLYRDKRQAAVREAQWRVSRRRAEYEQRVDDVNQQVQVAYERFDESQQTLRLYVQQILPAAQLNVQSALAAYESGGDFLRLIAAQRQLIVLQERYQEAIADYHRRRIELERVVGGPLNTTPLTEQIPPGPATKL